RGVDDALGVRRLRHVALHGDRLAAPGGDVGHDLVRPGLAAGVVDHHRRALGGELAGDLRPDALRRAGDDGDLAFELLRHDRLPFGVKPYRAATARGTTRCGTLRGTTGVGPRTPGPPPTARSDCRRRSSRACV